MQSHIYIYIYMLIYRTRVCYLHQACILPWGQPTMSMFITSAGHNVSSTLSYGQLHASTLSAPLQRTGKTGSPLQALLPHHTSGPAYQQQNCPPNGSAMVQGGVIDGTDTKEGIEKKPTASGPETISGHIVRGPSLGELGALSAVVRSRGTGKQHQNSSTELSEPCTDGVLDRPAESACREQHVANASCEDSTAFTCTAPQPPPPPPPKQCSEDTSVSSLQNAPPVQPIVHFKALPFRLKPGCGTATRTTNKRTGDPPPPSGSPLPLPLHPAAQKHDPVPPRSTTLPPSDPTAQGDACDERTPSVHHGATLDPDELHQHIKMLSALSLGCDTPVCMV